MVSATVINLADLLVTRDRTYLDRDFFNARFGKLVAVLNGLGARMVAVEAVEADVVALGLERINTTLSPLLEMLQRATQEGFLVASSETALTIVQGNAYTWTLAEASRDLFEPTPFLVAMDNADSAHWAILSNPIYDKATGALLGNVDYLAGSGACSDWTIAASGAVIPAMADMLAQTIAARDIAVAANEGIDADVATAEALVEQILQAGAMPVTSVAGRTGAIVLAIADITGLTTALSGKVSTETMNSALSAKANLSSPALTGTPTAPTPTAGDDSTRVATTAYVLDAAVLPANNLSDLTDNATARTNLGLGDAAVADIGTTTGTVAAGDDARFSGLVTAAQVAALTVSLAMVL